MLWGLAAIIPARQTVRNLTSGVRLNLVRPVVVGARSGLLLLLDNIGAIIIDEEHEATYKQESNPRYHARDVALLRAKSHELCLVLGQQHPLLRHGVRASERGLPFS